MAAADYDLEEAATLVCKRYRLAVDALAMAANADEPDGMPRDHAAVAAVAHLRALDEFLWKDRINATRSTDVRAVDFAADWIESEHGATVPGMVDIGDQRIAHITMRRASTGYSFWDPRGLMSLLVRSMGLFVRELERFHSDRARWFRPTHEKMAIHPLLNDDLPAVPGFASTCAGSVKVYHWQK